MRLLNVIRNFKKSFSDYQPSVEVLLYKKNLLHNINQFKQNFPKIALAPVLKSNAYGHGLIEIANILDQENVPFFVVDSLYEAKVLSDHGIKTDILVIGYTNSSNISSNKLSGISFAITSLDQLNELNKTISKKTIFHLKIDTGMHRQGLLPNQVDDAVSILRNNKYFILEGLCTHLASADNPSSTYTNIQIRQWNEIVNKIKNRFSTLKYFHFANSTGTYYTNQAYCNVARLGIGLYGINTSPQNQLDLKPVLELQTIVSSIRTLTKGETVGYNQNYTVGQVEKIATIPVGYFEGVDRRLSNNGIVKINCVDCPIVGQVSMNITSVNVTAITNPKVGNKVTVISANNDDKNSVKNIAKEIKTIPYEILVHIPQHLRRTIIN